MHQGFQDWIAQIQDLSIRFPQASKPVWEKISLQIQRDTIYGIFGETGCGKSTFAKYMAGLSQAKLVHGTIQLKFRDGFAINAALMSNKQKKAIWGRRMVYVPQDPYQILNPQETLEDQLQRLMQLYPNHKHYEQVLDEVQLSPSILSYFPSSLSAGQRQRAAIACSLIAGPELLIFDEPLASLDASTRDVVMQTFQNLVQQGHTIVMISHEIPKYHAMIPNENRYYFNLAPDPQECNALDMPQPKAPIAISNLQSYGASAEPSKVPQPKAPITISNSTESSNTSTSSSAKHSQQQASHPLLTLQGITKIFDGFPALHQVNLELRTYDWIYLQGANGCGKTTLLQVILGLLTPDQGRFYWESKEIPWNQVRQHSYRHIHAVFQDVYHSFNPMLTMGQSFQEIFSKANGSYDMQPDLQQFLGILELSNALLDRRPHELSYGQQKRMAIARGLLKHRLCSILYPQVSHLILLDEVLSGIHHALRKKIIASLQDLSRTLGLSLIWVAHDDADLQSACQAIVRLD